MNNKITKVVFPLSEDGYLQNYEYTDRDITDIFYVSIPIKKLHKAVKISRKQNTEIMVIKDIFVFGSKHNTFIIIERKYRNLGIYIPKLYTSVSYEWLLEQIETVRKNVNYTENCLLHDSTLVVFNTVSYYKSIIPTRLIKILTKILKYSIKNKEDFTDFTSSDVWNYLTNFIIIDESTNKILASDKLKRLVIDMKLRNMQNTTVYYVLYSIFKLTKDLQ